MFNLQIYSFLLKAFATEDAVSKQKENLDYILVSKLKAFEI